MAAETINTQQAVELFHRMLQDDSQVRILRLVGETKIGKSHLLTKVFPEIARDHHCARIAIIDLRNVTHTIPDLLDIASSQLGDQTCSHYLDATAIWANRPKVEVKNLLTIFSRVTISSRETPNDFQDRDRYFTASFLQALAKMNDKPLLLLFDSVDRATPVTRAWLFDTLIPQLACLPHVRVTVAGRDLPEASGSCTALCKSYRMKSVKKVEEYFAYCQLVKTTASENTIQALVRASRYTPGFFVELLSNYESEKGE